MQIQGSPAWHRDGGVVVKKDLLILGVSTAVVSSVGVSQLLFQSGAPMLLILLALLSSAWLYVLRRKPAKTRPAIAPVEKTSSKPFSAMRVREAIAPRLPKQLLVGFTYVAALCVAGIVVTGGTMGTVVLVSIAVLALIGAVISFLFVQASRSRSGHV